MNSNADRAQTLIVSVILGALAGLGVGFLLLKRADENEGQPSLTAREGANLGLMILGLFRQVAQLSDGE